MQKIELAKPSDLVEIKNLVASCKLSIDYVDEADLWLVSRDDPELIVGCMALERRGARVHIQSLSVRKEFRRRGIARGLIGQAFTSFLSPGDTLVALTLFWNKQFYLSVGFQVANAKEIKEADDIGRREKHRHCMALVREKV